MAAYTIAREERISHQKPWRVIDMDTIESGLTLHNVACSAQMQYGAWLDNNPDRRIVVHEWDQ